MRNSLGSDLDRRTLLGGFAGLATAAVVGGTAVAAPKGRGPKPKPRPHVKTFTDGVGLREYSIIVGPPGGVGESSDFPDATNTGHTNMPGFTGLTAYSGPDPLRTANSNQTFTEKSFEGITCGVVGDETSNITFRGCRFRSSWNEGWNIQVRGTNIRFEYCTIEPLNSQAIPVTFENAYQYGIDIRGSSSVVAEYCNIWGFGNAFQIETSSQALPVTVQHCYIHDAADQGNAIFHHDGFLSNNGGPQYVTLHHNSIVSGGNTNAIALQSTGTAYSNITLTENLLGGFGYTVNIGDDVGASNTNIIFEDNVFTTVSPLPGFGPFKNAWAGTANGCSWRRNLWRYDGNGDPTADGKYWLPNGGTVGNWNVLTGWVSATDYAG